MTQVQLPLSLGVLEAGPLAPALAERYVSHTAFVRAFLGPLAPDMTFSRYRVFSDELPEAADAHDAFIITGSRYSVYDPLTWIAALKAFVRGAAETRPVIGICFGHQLLAEAFGGKVEKAEQGWGIGVHRYRFTKKPAWMNPEREEVALIVSHQDQVVALPPGAEVLAGSIFCPIGAMQIGRNVLSIQAHPEMRPDYGHDLYEMRRGIIDSAMIDRAQASLAEPTDGDTVARWMLAFISERAPRHAASAR